jgi:secondary thiamine-phosphate synthase enzyme
MRRESLRIRTKKLYDFVDLTQEVQEIVKRSGIGDGMVFLNSMHNTTALIVQEADASIHHDLQKLLGKVVPLEEEWEHSYEGRVNATAHLKQNLLGCFLAIPFKDGELVLGTWQRIFLVELFEPREREVVITLLG